MKSFPVTSIHQIELTSRCNLRCKYCVHPTMPRAKVDMARDIFERALHWAGVFQGRGTQGEVNLAGIGESTIHPHFIEMLTLARLRLGPVQQLSVTTNGVAVTQELAEEVAWANQGGPLLVFVSLHRPERAQIAVESFRRLGLLAGVSTDAATSAVDWAGQVKWPVTAKKTPCPWVRGGWVMVTAEGQVTRCCFDGSGAGNLDHIQSADLLEMRTSAYGLCETCHHDVAI